MNTYLETRGSHCPHLLTSISHSASNSFVVMANCSRQCSFFVTALAHVFFSPHFSLSLCFYFFPSLSLFPSPRDLALLLGVQHTPREAGYWCHHLWYRFPDRLQGLPPAESDLASLQWVLTTHSNPLSIQHMEFVSFFCVCVCDNKAQCCSWSCWKWLLEYIWWSHWNVFIWSVCEDQISAPLLQKHIHFCGLTSFAVISLSVIEAVIIIVLIFLRRRVRIAIALLKEGSRWMGICVCVCLIFCWMTLNEP